MSLNSLLRPSYEAIVLLTLFRAHKGAILKVLITAGMSRLSQELTTALGENHDVVLTDRINESTNTPFIRSDLGHDESTNTLVSGMDVIVHNIEEVAGTTASQQLDRAMRCTYNLLWAATMEKVQRFIFLSSLRIMGGHSEDLVVTERWRPAPTPEPSVLSYHLAEYVCREFSRERKVAVICLRLGNLTWDDAAPSTSALYPNDAIQAVERAVEWENEEDHSMQRWNGIVVDLTGWDIFHIQSEVPDARFLTTAGQERLGYAPAKRF